MAATDQRLHRPYLVGIGGVGMSALAAALRLSGMMVSGSDRGLEQVAALRGGARIPSSAPARAALVRLQGMGARIHPQDGSGLDSAITSVIVSTAVEADNADLQRAHQLKIPVMHRAEALAGLVRGQEVLAVAGTAGKTTVTGMLAYVLTECGKDPGLVNGGQVLNWFNEVSLGNARVGGSGQWVLEVDESDRSLLHFTPNRAMITNISKDHYELPELYDLFTMFVKSVSDWVLIGQAAADQLATIGCPLDHCHIWNPDSIEMVDHHAFLWRGRTCRMAMPGKHNMLNAAMVLECTSLLGVPEDDAVDALSTFQGIHRRLEVVGRPGSSVTVLDDYAHNPAKIEASWEAARGLGRRVHAVWRPHGFKPLELMFDELSRCFTQQLQKHNDRGYILPVYYAGGTVQPGRTHEDLVHDAEHERLRAVPDYSTLETQLYDEVEEGDVILFMGARDPEITSCAWNISTLWV